MVDKEYGKFLKRLRIDKEEMLQDMAERLGLKSSYLSAIESGTRDIPVDLTEKLCKEYRLNDSQRNELRAAELNSNRKIVQMNIEGISGNRLAKETVLNFAGKFSSLSDRQLREINEILNRKEVKMT